MNTAGDNLSKCTKQLWFVYLHSLPRTYFWCRDKCLWRKGMWSSFSRLLKSTRMPPATSSTTCSMSLCLPLTLFALGSQVIWKCYIFSKHMTHNPLQPTSASVQCFSPEPARQVMLHHVWILAGPSLLDEVGLEWLHGNIIIIIYANNVTALHFVRHAESEGILPCWGNCQSHPFH